jgi:putative RecB family exonuclease
MTTETHTRESLAAGQGGIWDYVSPSRLGLWLKCPLAFKLKYIDGVEPRPSPSMFVGRMVHKALERWYLHRQLDVPLESRELGTWLVENWARAREAEQVAFESTAEEDASRSQTVALVAAYLAQLPSTEPRPLAVETAITAPLVDPDSGEQFGLPLVGVVDLVLDEPAGGLIADFKTAARGGEVLETAHEIQLSSYSLLCRYKFGGPEAGLEIRSLIKTQVPRVEYHRYSPRSGRHFRRLFAVLRAYLDDLDRGRFVFRPGIGCSMCEHRDNRCRDWDG